MPWLRDSDDVQLLLAVGEHGGGDECEVAPLLLELQKLAQELIFLAVGLRLTLLGAKVRDLFFERRVFLLECGRVLVILALVGRQSLTAVAAGAERVRQHARDVFKHRGRRGKVGQKAQCHGDRRSDGQNAQPVLTEKFFQGLPSFHRRAGRRLEELDAKAREH